MTKSFNLVLLVSLLLAPVLAGQEGGGGAEQVSLTAGNYTVTFDPGYPASSAQYGTADLRQYTMSTVDFGPNTVYVEIKIWKIPHFYASNSADIMHSFPAMPDRPWSWVAADPYDITYAVIIYKLPKIISGYPGASAGYSYSEGPLTSNPVAHPFVDIPFFDIEIRLSAIA